MVDIRSLTNKKIIIVAVRCRKHSSFRELGNKTYWIKSFLSLSFFNPPKAILVPGIYFFGFSRYSNCFMSDVALYIQQCFWWRCGATYKCVLIPGDSLLLVGIGVWVALNGTSLTSEKTVEVRTDLVSLTLTESVALSTSGLEEVGTLLCVSCRRKL